MHLVTLNAAGKQLAAPVALDPRRRRLSQVIGRHVDRTRPHMIAVQRARDPLQPIDEAWITRGRDRAGNVKTWPRKYLPADAVVVVVYLPLGGSGGGRSSTKGTVVSIAAVVAAVALATFGGPTAIALLGPIFGPVALAGAVVGLTAIASIASRTKAEKQATDRTQVYGVTGGGNLPKPGERIPRGYGRSWMKPDLSQPDFSQYDGDDQILFKRHTVGLGRYRPYAVRAGKQIIWTEAGGFQAPFDDPRNQIEFVYGTASSLVPSNVISATGVGGLLPRPGDNPAIAGPFLLNRVGPLVTRLQVDFQFPQGISRNHTFASGTVLANQPAEWSVVFQYAAIDESGAIVGPWQELYDSNSGKEGARFATHPLRYTKFKDVPPGRYAVRGWNVMPDTSEVQGSGTTASINACQWDGASGWVGDAAIRPGVTEMCLRIYATKASQAVGWSEIEVDAGAIIPVWTADGGWEEQETSKAVWAWLDVMRNQDYGGALPDSQVDLERCRYYADALTEFDTFDGTIRGPVSVWEAASTVLLPMRAEPVHLGRYWSLVRDEPKAVRRHVITPRQMLKGSTQIVFDLDTAAGASHVIGEYDRDGDYRNPGQTTAIYGEASLKPTRRRWSGVRTFAHAQHLTRWLAACGFYRRQTTPFGVEMEGRIYKRGDSILVDQWFVEARRRAGIVDVAGSKLVLDADVAVAAGDAAMLRDRTGRAWGPVTLHGQGSSLREIILDPPSRAAAEAASGVSLAQVLSDGRGEMTTVLVGPLEVLSENYLIKSVKPDGPDRAQVEAVIDDQRVWDAIGAPIVAPPPTGNGLADPEVPHIDGLDANAVQAAAGLSCDYSVRPGRGSVRFELQLSYDDGARFSPIYDGTATTGSWLLNPVDPGHVVLRARAFGATGLPGPWFYKNLTIGASKVPGENITDFSLRLEQMTRQLQAEIIAANDLGRGTRALGEELTQLALSTADDTLRGAIQQLAAAFDELAGAQATLAADSFEQRELLRVGDGANFAALERETLLRYSADEALASVSTQLAARLALTEGDIAGQATVIQGLSATVTNQGGVLTAQGEQLVTVGAQITAANLAIAGQATATQGLTSRVALTESGISTLSQDLTALRGTVTGQGGTILAQGTALDSLTVRTSSTEGRLDTEAARITALQGSVTSHGLQLAGAATALDQVTTRVSAAEGNISVNGQAIQSLAGSISYVDGRVSQTASAINSVEVRATNLEGVQSTQAQAIQALSTTQGDHTASISTIATSVDGIKVQYSITGYVDGESGGLVITGARRLDGAVQFEARFHGNLFVSRTITARTLAVEQLIVNGQIFDNAVSTVRGAEGGGFITGYSFTNTRGQNTRLAIFAMFRPRTAGGFGNASQVGNIEIRANGNVIRTEAGASFTNNGVAYMLPDLLIKQIDVGPGTYEFQAVQTNVASAGVCDILVMEISK